ncbi:MAG: nitrate ABC transporter substrate-binding protein [Piscirickettsiaceae bacterium CG_4_10_14_3_um_filter_44_349]|nr:ABC transporter substrate-binding protein [Thiomicrospira sp.]PIQ03881.1 MAG: nitrate ABC transporter substrate-binding protein [Piscirickettsiaceae bacterium CG18_big_fil_WC_8_21_14_2_50_44_103]PIW77686.1 MAG: nitrate ABC transporter substrate-binding protein [Piscirickettsiaceae bacterium CG_4_8_14_3_um_filter_44_38]PIX78476.1 MAG: nitrate ABC transporter substrate-binding protein [Piscirickettsiaceae bacterium CG_4_10_14_3_um_filter_44_349]PIY76185.1 MAG: nitrate ABC transporter substrate
MSFKSLNDPFNEKKSLLHKADCDCPICQVESSNLDTSQKQAAVERSVYESSIQMSVSHGAHEHNAALDSNEAIMDRAIESAVVRSVFGHNELSRRSFLSMVGASTAAAVLGTVFPMEEAKAALKESMGMGKLEKSKLNIGFVPITCATPIIMAHPMGFYEKNGLDVNVIKTAGWAVARDKSLAKEYDAAHMLTPMPLAMSMGAGSSAKPFIMPTVENINGQAIVLHVDHKDKRDPKQWKGFKFGVPFEYSMHNFLLRYYVAEHGLDPDVDIQIRVVPPPEMVANLRAGNLDGYLSPDPFNQRAVWEKVGFIHMLTKDIWEGHPCCAFACSKEFAVQNPNTYGALLRSIIDATEYSAKAENRKEISAAIAPKNYLNQPVAVIEQVLTGRYADGLGGVQNVPSRIDFDPFPWHSMGVWILTQMKRWGYIEGHIDYHKIAEEVYLAAETGQVMKELGYTPPDKTYKNYFIMGKEFDYNKPEDYLASFKIKR